MLSLQGANKCKFFIWDQNEDCTLFDYSIHEFDISCHTIGGLPSPDLDMCHWIYNGTENCQVMFYRKPLKATDFVRGEFLKNS